MILNAALLAKLMVCQDGPLTAKYLDPMKEALLRAEINTPLRVAHFFSQVGHECGGLRYQEELADGADYEGRRDLGNTVPGDGPRYKGRGLIQLTGRKNYSAFADYLGDRDIMFNPHRVAKEPTLAALSAAWYWDRNKLNQFADKDNLEALTRKVNGGLNGLEDRRKRLANAKRVLGI